MKNFNPNVADSDENRPLHIIMSNFYKYGKLSVWIAKKLLQLG